MEILGRLRTPRLAAAPASPAVGEMYYDTALNTLFWWNGTTWQAAGGAAGIPSTEAWRTIGQAGQPAYINSWAKAPGSANGAQFCKDPLGFVHLRGQIYGGASGASAFQLPVGYRPSSAEALNWAGIASGVGGTTLNLGSSGDIIVYYASISNYYGADLAPIYFRAEL